MIYKKIKIIIMIYNLMFKEIARVSTVSTLYVPTPNLDIYFYYHNIFISNKNTPVGIG